MGRLKYSGLVVSSSPHITDSITTSRIMLDVIIALLPAAVMAGVIFGQRAILMMFICVASCVAFEYLFRLLVKRSSTIGDFSAVVTGLLLSFNLPSNLPFWMAIIGCFAAIVVVKQLFGGIGQNFINPALAGRIILLVSFATPMTTWPAVKSLSAADAGVIDSMTCATPLGQLAFGELEQLPSYSDLFFGYVGGCLGETCAAALLAGGVYLCIRKVISPVIPLVYLGTVALFALLAGEDPLFHLLAGGVMLGAIFMATDYTTSPITTKGKVVFAFGCGILTMVIRLYGSYPEGVSFAIVLMNIVTPLIDHVCCQSKNLYGGAGK